jgi:oligopeptide/dipeptide ABC transporter, ATP-binding protein, C-terminal domain
MELTEKSVLMESPAHPYAVSLLSSVPRIGSEKLPDSIPGYPPDLRSPPRDCVFHPRCPYASELCKSIEPPVAIVESRKVKCWLYIEK